MRTYLPHNSAHNRQFRWLLNAIILLAGTLPLRAHVGAPPLSSQGKALPISFLQQIALPATEVAKELAADAKVGKAAPLRFAVAQPLALTTTNSGTWARKHLMSSAACASPDASPAMNMIDRVTIGGPGR